MADLSFELCGIPFKNPVIAASGTFGNGLVMALYNDLSLLGGISMKAVTLEPREGNPPVRIAETASGCLNAIGLQNPGIDVFLAQELPRAKRLKTRLIANVSGSKQEDYVEVIRRLQGSGIDMIELNISCPNVKEGGVAFGTNPDVAAEITRACKTVCDVPLMVKLSPNVSDIVAIAKAVEAAGADAISLINTLTAMAVDARSRRPILANITGGLSGPAIKPVALRMVYQVTKAVQVPVVGMGGIMSGLDVAEFLLCGASAVMVGTANLSDPSASLRILAEFQAFLDQEGIEDWKALVGGLKV